MNIYLHQNDLPDGLKLGSTIAIDSETMGLKMGRDRLCLVQISDGNNEAHLIQFDSNSDYQAPNLKALLQDTEKLKLFHYARFDMAMIYAHLGVMITPVYCTKIASKLVRTYTDKHGLKNLVQEFLGHDISKVQQSSDWGALQLSEAQQRYAAEDVLYLHSLKERLDQMLNREGRSAIAQQCFDFLKTRVHLDLAGFETMDIFSHS